MKLRAEQLAAHLQQGLAPIYLVSGDEPFQADMATRQIREAALAQGYSEREQFYVDGNFDWDQLQASASNLSLFAEKKLMDLRLPGGKSPGKDGGKALSVWADAQNSDILLLISMGKLDKKQQQSKWFKALDKTGVVIQIWPVEAAQMADWIRTRMQVRGMQPEQAAVQMLAERLEGNLLAADQELEKLRLLCGEGKVDVEQVSAAVSDSARFDVFALVDAALLGDMSRLVRIFNGLREEGLEPVLVLWALTREIRTMTTMAWLLAQGNSVEQVLGQYRVWNKRKAPVSAGLRRHSLRRWQGMLYQAAAVERVIKGRAAGAPWDELVQLGLKIAGMNLLPRKSA
ncbi:DNA polymerase III delta subunit [hydrothermal vent metagenome]|uniref:DNA polymerase III subunit delta n=1 Tax=hydrothermal vent metagenome TaxID=652676 RepID=A0A3B1B6S5_9ZZZZ